MLAEVSMLAKPKKTSESLGKELRTKLIHTHGQDRMRWNAEAIQFTACCAHAVREDC